MLTYFGLIVLGVLNAFSFSIDPLPHWLLCWLQAICITILLLFVWSTNRPKRAFLYGVIFATTQFAIGLHWLYISMHDYGGLNILLSILAVLLFSLYLSIYSGLSCYFTCLFTKKPGWFSIMVWASFWTLGEWLRGTVFTGFPWIDTSYAHIDGFLIGWAPILGSYGVTWWVAICGGLFAVVILAIYQQLYRPAIKAIILLVLSVLVGFSLKQISWSSPIGKPMTIRLAQTNTPQDIKFDAKSRYTSIINALQLAKVPSSLPTKPQVIIFPETTISFIQTQLPFKFWDDVIKLSRSTKATLFLGIPLLHNTLYSQELTNSVIQISKNTTVREILDGTVPHYNKQHLVPLGEFIPYGFHWFVHALGIPLEDFDSGKAGQDNFIVGSQVLGPDICYEDIFGNELLPALFPSKHGSPGATILFNISNLAWFGNTIALGQHLQMARMRAIETARPMVRATNTGTTAYILPNGQVRAALPTETRDVLDVQVQGMTGYTVYSYLGNWPIILLCFLIILIEAIKIISQLRYARHSR